MNLAWHIAKKDMRRLALPTGGWLVVLVAAAIAFRVISPPAEGHAASAIDMWQKLAMIWGRLLEWLQIFIAGLLAGYLVIDDPLTDTNSFWLTRPISRGRLLAAKLMAAAVLFLAAPIALLLPVWLACGFGAGDIAAAGWQFVASHGGWILFALMAASLARSLPQFLFFSLVIAGGFAATSVIAASVWRDAPMAVYASREWLVMTGVLPVMGVVLTHQFLTRRVARTWLLVGGALVAALLIRSTWLHELPIGGAAPRLEPPRAGDHAEDIVAAPSFTKYQANSVPTLYGKTVWRPDIFFVPMIAHSPRGEVAMRAGGMWEAQASLHALQAKPPTDPLRWQLVTRLFRPVAMTTDGTNLAGTLEVWAVRTRVLGEMPVRVGAELRVGANRTRILALQFNEGRLDRIYLEESDALAHSRGRWNDPWSARTSGNESHVDCYALVNAAKDIVSPASVFVLGQPVEIGSFAKQFRDLSVGWGEKERGPPMLVKLRYERDHAFGIPLEVRGVSTRGPEQLP